MSIVFKIINFGSLIFFTFLVIDCSEKVDDKPKYIILLSSPVMRTKKRMEMFHTHGNTSLVKRLNSKIG